MKKTAILLLLTLCVAVGTLSFPTETARAEVSYLPEVKTNLLANGGFESGTAGWDTNWVGEGSGLESGEVFAGASAYRFHLNQDGVLAKNIEVFPAYDMNLINQKHTKYLVSGRLKKGADFAVGADPFRMTVRIVVRDAESFVDLTPGDNDKVTFAAGDEEYVRFTQEITLEERYKVGAQSYKWYEMQILFLAGTSTGTVYVDDVAMTYAQEPENGTIENLFDSAVTKETAIGTPFCGSEYFFAGGGTDYSIDPTVAYKNIGGASLKYTANANNDGTNIYMTIPINRFANDIYHFSFMVKGKNAGTKAGLPAQYPYGIYSFPWLRGEGEGDTRFPERLTYVTGDGDWSYRPFVNGIFQNGNSVIVTSRVEDFDWTKVSIRFNPHAFVSEARGENGKTYSGDDIVDFALILYTMGLQGEYWFDSFKMYRDGTGEPDFTTDFKLSAERLGRGYLGEDAVLPAPSALCQVGEELVDVSAAVTLTVTDPAGDKVRDAVAATPDNLKFRTDKAGYWSVRFHIKQDTRERVLEYEFPVAERDVTAPVIGVAADDLAGKTGRALRLPAATAEDREEGDLTNRVKVEIRDQAGQVVMAKRQANVVNSHVFATAGTYQAVYTLADSSGNEAAAVTVKIIVEEAAAGGCGALAAGGGILPSAALIIAAAVLVKRRRTHIA